MKLGGTVPYASSLTPPEPPSSSFSPLPTKAYQVQRGDTLFELAKRSLPSGASHQQIMDVVNELARANNLSDINKISAGSTLQMPFSMGPPKRPSAPRGSGLEYSDAPPSNELPPGDAGSSEISSSPLTSFSPNAKPPKFSDVPEPSGKFSGYASQAKLEPAGWQEKLLGMFPSFQEPVSRMDAGRKDLNIASGLASLLAPSMGGKLQALSGGARAASSLMPVANIPPPMPGTPGAYASREALAGAKSNADVLKLLGKDSLGPKTLSGRPPVSPAQGPVHPNAIRQALPRGGKPPLGLNDTMPGKPNFDMDTILNWLRDTLPGV